MNRKIFATVLLLTLLVSLFAATGALADHQDPIGDCPRAFELHHYMGHTDHMHQHIGPVEDANGDGYVCMKHLPNDFHLHIENHLPLN
jgi:hypothetical protein